MKLAALSANNSAVCVLALMDNFQNELFVGVFFKP